jgi:hypothetical protein
VLAAQEAAQAHREGTPGCGRGGPGRPRGHRTPAPRGRLKLRPLGGREVEGRGQKLDCLAPSAIARSAFKVGDGVQAQARARPAPPGSAVPPGGDAAIGRQTAPIGRRPSPRLPSLSPAILRPWWQDAKSFARPGRSRPTSGLFVSGRVRRISSCVGDCGGRCRGCAWEWVSDSSILGPMRENPREQDRWRREPPRPT